MKVAIAVGAVIALILVGLGVTAFLGDGLSDVPLVGNFFEDEPVEDDDLQLGSIDDEDARNGDGASEDPLDEEVEPEDQPAEDIELAAEETVRSELINATIMQELYFAEHGRFGAEGLEDSNSEVSIVVFLRDSGQTYCLEGYVVGAEDIMVASYDMELGVSDSNPCEGQADVADVLTLERDPFRPLLSTR